MDYHVKETETLLLYEDTQKKKSPLNMKTRGCQRTRIFKVHICGTEIPIDSSSLAWCSDTAAFALRCLSTSTAQQALFSMSHVFLQLLRKEEAAHEQALLARHWCCQELALHSGLLWKYSQNTNTRQGHSAAVKNQNKYPAIMSEHKNMRVVQTTKMTKQTPMLANMHYHMHQLQLQLHSIPCILLDIFTQSIGSPLFPTACNPGQSPKVSEHKPKTYNKS